MDAGHRTQVATGDKDKTMPEANGTASLFAETISAHTISQLLFDFAGGPLVHGSRLASAASGEVPETPQALGTDRAYRSATQDERAVPEISDCLVQVINTVPVIVWSATADGRLEAGNTRWTELIGGRAGASVEAELASRMSPSDAKQRHKRWRRALQLQAAYEVEYRLREGDADQAHWYLERGVPLRDAATGALRGWAAVAAPIDATKRKEEELCSMLRRRDEFFATLLHELRNPLAPIANALEILAADATNTVTVSIARGIIQRQLHQLSRLVDDLLDVSQIESGRFHLRPRPVVLDEILALALEGARPIIELRRQILTTSKPETPVTLTADPVRLAQVLTNLLINAAKYTHVGGHISLITTREQDTICIRVRDDGIGIRPDKLGEVFQLFSRAAPESASSSNGLGVGLAIARQLIESHGGTITAQSEGVGRGTEFTIRLPQLKRPAGD